MTSEPQQSFEEAMSELEKLVHDMESGELPLEKMIQQFEHGMKLVKTCRSKLDVMSKKIELLLKDDGKSGEYTEFAPDSERTRAALQPSKTAVPPVENSSAEESLPF